MDWKPTDKPCAILGCGARDKVFMEPKLSNPVCGEHAQLLNHDAAAISQCRNNPWERMKLLGDYRDCPPKYEHLGGDVE